MQEGRYWEEKPLPQQSRQLHNLPKLVSLDILDMVTEVSVVVGDLLRRADAKASHLGELQKTQAMKFNMVVCKRILAEAEVAMGAFELDFQ